MYMYLLVRKLTLKIIYMCDLFQAKLDLDIGKAGTDHERLLELCKTVIRYSVKTSKVCLLAFFK